MTSTEKRLATREQIIFVERTSFSTQRELTQAGRDLLYAVQDEGLWEIYASRHGHPPWVDQALEKGAERKNALDGKIESMLRNQSS